MHKITFPVEFLSPYSREECVARLEAKRSRFNGIEVYVNSQTSSEQPLSFRVKVRNIYRRLDTFGDGEVVGWLESTPTTATRVVLEQVQMGNQTYVNIIGA